MERNNETRKRYNNIISPEYLKTREVSYHIVVISFFWSNKEEEILQVLKSEERAALKNALSVYARVCIRGLLCFCKYTPKTQEFIFSLVIQLHMLKKTALICLVGIIALA